MRNKPLLPTILLLLLCLTACAPNEADQVEIVALPETAAPLTLDMAEETALSPFSLAYYIEDTVDPAHAQYRANLSLSGLLYEGLFQLDTSFVAQPLLCKSYTTSSDGLVWTFAICEGITFTDGTPLTPQLVADSLTASAQSGSRYESRLSTITKIEATDTAVVLTLATPNNNLPALLDVPITLENEENELIPLGTGRYTLDSENLVLTPYRYHWQTTLQTDVEIPLHAIRYTDDLVSSFDAGYISLVDIDMMGTQAPYFSSSYQAWDYATSNLVYLAFNTREAADNPDREASPCTSTQLRHIISLSVDRSSIVRQDFAQYAVAATLPIHPSSPVYDVLLAATGDYSPAILAAALDEYIPPSEPLQLITAEENASRVFAAKRIVEQLNGIGIATELVTLTWDDYLIALETGDFDLYLAETQMTADFDLTSLIGTEGSLNYGGYSSVTTDQLILNARSASTAALSTAATQLYTQVLEDAPIVPICFKNGSVLTQWGRVTQLTATQSNTFYQIENWGFYTD